MSFSQIVRNELLSDDNLTRGLDDNRSFVRDCFLYGGVISNPGKTYHVEFTLPEEKIEPLMQILIEFELNPKKIARKGQTVIYIKDADGISDILNIMGAHKSLIALEELRVEKYTRNNVNRKVNFETANLNKTALAAQSQIDAIKYIEQHKGLGFLSKPLRDVAILRLEEETLSLTEIGELLKPSISKSGVNHRLRKICKIASNINMREGDIHD